ncbi:MAG: VanW family protein [Caldilineaceae bacterium]
MQSTLSASHRSRLARSSTPGSPIARTPFDFLALLLLVLVLALTSIVIGWQFWYSSRIFSGVMVADTALGGITRVQALGRLNRTLASYPPPAVALTYGEQQWPLPASQVKAEVDRMDAVNRAYLVGRQGAIGRRLGEQFVAALGGIKIQPDFGFNEELLRQAIAEVAAQVQQPGLPARQIGDVMLPAEEGRAVDIEQTLMDLLTALQAHSAEDVVRVPLHVVDLAPPAETLAAPTPAALAAVALPQPVLLHNADFELDLAVDSALIEAMVVMHSPLRIDNDPLRRRLTDWAEQFDLPARDARLHFNPATGSVTVLQPSQPGRHLDIEATIAAVHAALTKGATQAELVLVETSPAVDMNRVAEMGIRELVASGTTYFAGSSAARVRNIEVAAEKFAGLVIPPGEIFSFNQGVEDVTSANGFEDSLIIWGDQTAVGVGGGVCQVSTTVFRAAYSAGLPIVERYNHGYVVSWYGEPGLDATIYTPTVDFRFRNDTGAYLLIDPEVDTSNGVITFNLYGTKPNREVTVSKPEQTEIIKPAAPEYRIDESLAPGQRKQVEWEQLGMTVTVTRTIVESGTTRTDTMNSVYQPWRAVYLVPPGTEIPATPTPEPAATETEATAAPASAP